MTMLALQNGRSDGHASAMKSFLIYCALTLLLFLAACHNADHSQTHTDDSESKEPAVTLQPAADGIYYLDQGWSDADRQEYYHLTQGTRILPYDWFLALEMAESEKPFISDESMARFRFIPNKNNPDGLPVGFAKTILDPSFKDPLSNEWVGFACSACHTGEMTYQGKNIRIDGGPAMIESLLFPKAMVMALAANFQDEAKRARFVAKVLKTDTPDPQAVKALSMGVQGYLKSAAAGAARDKEMGIYPLDWGFGRLDALGRGGNLVLQNLSPKNVVPAKAPVSFPAVWGAYELDWVQWNGSIQQPLGRNLGEAIGVNSLLITTPGPDQFKTSVNITDLVQAENLLKKLKAPPWPGEFFGAIDKDKAAKGEALYKDLCTRCHDIGMTEPNEFGKSFKDVKMVSLEEIGTDVTDALDFNKRQVITGELGLGTIPAAQAIQALTNGILERQMKEGGYTPEQRAEMEGYRPNYWRDDLAYMARPHSGVWALAPYLHNGSVPNLYELLSPVEERSAVFYVGNLEFDPQKVGFVSTETPGAFKFDTSLDGNKNTGHEFKDGPVRDGVIGRALSEEERYQIIEYLKTR